MNECCINGVTGYKITYFTPVISNLDKRLVRNLFKNPRKLCRRAGYNKLDISVGYFNFEINKVDTSCVSDFKFKYTSTVNVKMYLPKKIVFFISTI